MPLRIAIHGSATNGREPMEGASNSPLSILGGTPPICICCLHASRRYDPSTGGGMGWRLLRLAMLVLFLRLLYNTLIVLQSKVTGEPVSRETDGDALRHLPVERPDQLR